MADNLILTLLISSIIVFSGILILRSRVKLKYRLLLFYLLAIPSFFSFRLINNSKGKPIKTVRTLKNVIILGYYANMKERRLFVWILEESKVPKSLEIPFSEKLSKDLNKMRRKYKGRPYKATIMMKSIGKNGEKKEIKGNKDLVPLNGGNIDIYIVKNPPNINVLPDKDYERDE